MPPGHIIGLSWDSALPKFGVDRGSGVRNDYGNPDHFFLGIEVGELSKTLKQAWQGQHLHDGLPVVQTVLERDGVRYEVEQFAYPLNGPPSERRGDIGMVLLERILLVNLEARPKTVYFRMTHRRELPASLGLTLEAVRQGDGFTVEDSDSHSTLLGVQGAGAADAILAVKSEKPAAGAEKGAQTKIALTWLPLPLPAPPAYTP